MAAHQAPPSLGFSRQEHWSGLPFPSPMSESENESEVAQSCPTLRDPMDSSLPGSSVPGIFQQEYWSGVPLPSPMWCMNTNESPCCHKLVSKLSFGNHWKDSFYLIIAQELLTNTSSDFIIFYIIFCLKTTRVSCPRTDSELFQTLAWCW